MKYHVNPTTMHPNQCRAKEGACPFGADAPHFETREAALYHAEVLLTHELGGSFAEKQRFRRLRLADEAQAKLSQAVAAKPQTEAAKDLKTRLAEAMDSTGDRISAWWDRHPNVGKNARRTAAAALLAGVVAGPVGGYMAGHHISDSMNGEQTITAVQTRDGQAHDHRSRGKYSDTIEVRTKDGDVTVQASDVYGENDSFWSTYGNEVVDPSNEGSTVTLTDITYQSSDGETHKVKDVVLERQTQDLMQRAVENSSNNVGTLTGAGLGLVAGLGSMWAGLTVMDPLSGGGGGGGYGSGRRSSNMALYIATGVYS